jgi:hypothetical protein
VRAGSTGYEIDKVASNPVIPVQAGIQTALGPRFRGDERTRDLVQQIAVARIERSEMRGGFAFFENPNLASLDPGYVLVRVPDALLRCARDPTTEASLERNRERTVDQRDFRNFGNAISRRAKNILIGCGKRRQITVFEKTDRSQRKPGVLPVHLGERA